MKFSTVIVSALAGFVSAAPVEERSQADLSQLNNLQGFGSLDIQYLAALNGLNLNLFNQLGSVNNFNLLGFQSLFQSNVFDVNQLLQLQQLQTLLTLAETGIFSGFDLSGLNLGNLNFGLINNVNSFDFSQANLIQQSLLPQIQSVAQTLAVVVI